MATTLNNLGVLHRDQNRMDEARKAYEEALTIYEKFAGENSERFKGDVTRIRLLLRSLDK